MRLLLRVAAVGVFVLVLSTLYAYLSYRPSYELYADLIGAEIQHSLFVSGSSTKHYVIFQQLQGAGFNNEAQEILHFHHLAFLTDRVYIYQPFFWRPRNEPLPLSAFLLGPTEGSVSDTVCPTEQITHITIDAPHRELWQTALDVLSSDDKCLAVDNWVLTRSFLESVSVAEIFPLFSVCLSTQFLWSIPIQHLAARTHAALNLRSSSYPVADPYIALHLRRGDFSSHCLDLAESQKNFTTWATLPNLNILPPALDVQNSSSIMEHCYPILPRVIDAIRTGLDRAPHARILHILHDAKWDHPLVYAHMWKIEKAVKTWGWVDRVTHSGQIPAGWGEGDFTVGVDMEVASKAAFFIGVGYSSLTSQVVALRLAGGQSEDSILLM
ncbi:uncharacterized protein BT62DRAFT_123787 [Guyanagaster necrorhizus]|uniref:Uncharacterized protein n=1 Tax=Guyanagaster necrorhizus TaxID=856835 RepID=A0A9P8AU38_9AGAR|nr:uncharacterized protein BT62DRAFT_123787 [Guyanagaster necrorhizus MCA 3950]KAG7446512.1 hypothetical protein BT62DRAFT_123787 [Guyanagaster necrorhizus MCA 3950]